MVQTIVKIDGMACGMCEAHINNAVRNAFRTKKVSSSHRKGECIIVSENQIDVEKLNDVILSLGYTLLAVKEENR